MLLGCLKAGIRLEPGSWRGSGKRDTAYSRIQGLP
jgi:hypothetical protein